MAFFNSMNRLKFSILFMTYLVIQYVLGYIVVPALVDYYHDTTINMITILIGFSLYVLIVFCAYKRLIDCGKSKWNLIFILIPKVQFLWFIYLCFPKSKISFSFTVTALSSGKSTPNNFNIIIVFAFPTTFISG